MLNNFRKKIRYDHRKERFQTHDYHSESPEAEMKPERKIRIEVKSRGWDKRIEESPEVLLQRRKVRLFCVGQTNEFLQTLLLRSDKMRY